MSLFKIGVVVIVPLYFYSYVLHAQTSATFPVFFENQFQQNSSCQSLSLSSSPYYVLNEDLNTTEAQLLQKGSIIDFNKKRVVRAWNSPRSSDLNTTIPNIFLDESHYWKIRILKQKKMPNDSPDFTGKTLEIYQINNKSIWALRCCQEKRCAVLPVYKVFENNKQISQLAFSFKQSGFIESYSLIGRNDTLTPPLQNENLITRPAYETQQQDQQTPPPASSSSTENPITSASTQQYVVCTRRDPLKIYDDSLQKIVYRIQRFQSIKVFQNWQGQREERIKDSFVVLKVQAENAHGQIVNGWAAAGYIKKASDCPSLGLVGSPTGETLIQDSTIVVDNTPGAYRFPTERKPQYDYIPGAGKRYFGAARDGRKHAACDLFRPQGEKVFAIANGQILRKYPFYAGTYAIEVKHDTGPVVRYGEVSSRAVAHSSIGDRVLKGQHIGYIDHLTMLHFEMYSDTATGPLTQDRGPFSRRSDLLDPTAHLKKWERETF
jgi:murein DD-endopeptidase MepM/ murein hydrolase activator NlpD